MNCFLLFILLKCCGWGSSCECRMEQSGCCGRTGREMSGRGCCEGMGSGRNDSCGRDMGRQQECCECREERRGCGCEDERNGRSGCGCEDMRNSRGGCGCEDDRNGRGGCGCEGEERGRGCGCEDGRDRDGCEEERRGCGCEEDRHDHDRCGCTERENNSDGSGMIPPPWQDYPRFPRRNNGNECDN